MHGDLHNPAVILAQRERGREEGVKGKAVAHKSVETVLRRARGQQVRANTLRAWCDRKQLFFALFYLLPIYYCIVLPYPLRCTL